MTKACAWMLALFCFSFFLNSAHADGKAWTVLVYLNGFNDLDSAAKMNLNQMESIGSSGDVNLVVEWGSLTDRKSTKRLLVQKDHDLTKVTSPVIQELGKADMGSPAVLQDFLLWGMQRYPADHYMVVVWDHGSGWHEFFPGKRVPRAGIRPSDISWDDISGNAITTEELGKVIREVSRQMGRKIDIYSSDACLMAMAEVAGEMDGAIDYFAGSEELEPEDGWPYDTIFSELTGHPAMSPRELATFVASSYVALNDGRDDATFSVFDMSYFAAFEESVEQLGAALSGFNNSDRVMTLRQVKASQTFYGDYVDFGDFLSRMRTHIRAEAGVVGSVQQALHNLVVANYKTAKYPMVQGLSLWMPSDRATYNTYKKRYSHLGFEQRTRWSRAIASYLN